VYLFIIRGLPGSGKTTLANTINPYGLCVAADDYMVNANGSYAFDPKRLSECHRACLDAVIRDMIDGDTTTPIAVHNTFSRPWEWRDYIDAAVEHGYTPIVIDLYDRGMSDRELAESTVHGVPVETIASMRSRWYRG
jgi:predicted kinase